jgi:hypothetical protein
MSRIADYAARDEWTAKVAAMSDEEFVKAAEMQIWLSAFANNNPRAPAHWKADLAYDEACRRERPWLYQQAWNRASRSAGHEPSEEDVRRSFPAQSGVDDGGSRAATKASNR